MAPPLPAHAEIHADAMTPAPIRLTRAEIASVIESLDECLATLDDMTEVASGFVAKVEQQEREQVEATARELERLRRAAAAEHHSEAGSRPWEV